MSFNSSEKPVAIFADIIESKAVDQFNSAMAQPFAVAGAVMPDVHAGYSLPIGSVIATDKVIVPSWVGYDIGCGMCAYPLKGVSKLAVQEHAKSIFNAIYDRIPVGPRINTEQIGYSLDGMSDAGASIAIKKKYTQVIGSLGGGNHFIEVGADENDQVWIVIHSGSRGVGHALASHYMACAAFSREQLGKEFDQRSANVRKHNPDGYEAYKERFIETKMRQSRPKEGHYGLHEDSDLGRDYIADLNWALDFALANRREMMIRVIAAICENLNIGFEGLDEAALINRNHNHAVKTDGLWIHRKGATQAEEGMMGVIPGNMRDGSFIVRGKGNRESLFSSSHGAGRVLGRRKAKASLDVKDFEEAMIGIQAAVGRGTLDESPFVYKNIFDVMQQQSDLVEVVAHVKPIINIKDTGASGRNAEKCD